MLLVHELSIDWRIQNRNAWYDFVIDNAKSPKSSQGALLCRRLGKFQDGVVEIVSEFVPEVRWTFVLVVKDAARLQSFHEPSDLSMFLRRIQGAVELSEIGKDRELRIGFMHFQR